MRSITANMSVMITTVIDTSMVELRTSFWDGQVTLLKAGQIRPANDNLPDANLTIHGIQGRDYSP